MVLEFIGGSMEEYEWKVITISDFRDRFPRLLEETVRNRIAFRITKKDEPYAVLEPIGENGAIFILLAPSKVKS